MLERVLDARSHEPFDTELRTVEVLIHRCSHLKGEARSGMGYLDIGSCRDIDARAAPKIRVSSGNERITRSPTHGDRGSNARIGTIDIFPMAEVDPQGSGEPAGPAMGAPSSGFITVAEAVVVVVVIQIELGTHLASP